MGKESRLAMIACITCIIRRLIDFLRDRWRGVSLGALRSSQWPSARKIHLALHPVCEVCGRKGTFLRSNSVHHIAPFSQSPSLELSQNNFITLCPDHHFFVGHLMNWKSWNVSVKEDATLWRNKIVNRPTGGQRPTVPTVPTVQKIK